MKIAIYTNILTPYRIFFYDALYKEFKANGDEFHVILMADTEPDRNWNYDDFIKEYTILLNSRTIAHGNSYIHFNNNLIATLENLKLDLIVCGGSYLCPGVLQVILWKKRFGYKTYFWSESHLNEKRDYGWMKIKVREFLRRVIYQRFDGFWYAGEMSLRFVKKYAKEDCELFFVPNLVEQKKYAMAANITAQEKARLRKKYSVYENKTVFICPVRLTHVKGIDRFISVLSKCSQKDEAVILVAGDGELKDTLKKQISELDVDVRLLGFQDQNCIVELYSLSDVFLLPSLSDPNPLTCVEALWAGMPMLISEHCGNYPEVVQPGENGYVFSYKDENEIIELIDSVIERGQHWRTSASDISKKIAANIYDVNTVVHALIENMKQDR